MIIRAVTPLLLDKGASVTSKQLAEAAGLAEGTLFRAFGDKDSLIQAAYDSFLDPGQFHRDLRNIDPQRPLRDKVLAIVGLMRDRFGGVFRIMSAVGPHEHKNMQSHREELDRIVTAILEPEITELNWPPATVAQLIRMLSFASSLPRINEGSELSADDLTDALLLGIVGQSVTKDTSHPFERRAR